MQNLSPPAPSLKNISQEEPKGGVINLPNNASTIINAIKSRLLKLLKEVRLGDLADGKLNAQIVNQHERDNIFKE